MEFMKKRSAFSLAELLITLIIVSCILAAFAPVITKRMANGGVSIGGSSGPAQQVEANVTIDGLTDVCDNPDCKLCIANACLICGIECPPPLSRDYKQCRCVDCSPYDAHCAECNSTQCKKCASGYRMVNNHCESCENLPDGQYCDGTGQVQVCPKGSYCINGTSNLCPENTYTNKTGQSDCTQCAEGKYSAQGATECIKCSSAYGSYCTECNSKTCTMCKDGYVVSGKECIEEDANIVGYNGLYIYKYNAGDPGGPEIPSTVKVVNANTSCSGDCCWKATDTVNTAADGCTSTGNGSSTYSGCKRTVCSYGAAQKICQNIGWRLPTYSEAASWTTISLGKGKAGLQLCDAAGGYKSAVCSNVARCQGSGNGHCYPYNVWADSGYYTHLGSGVISYGGSWSAYTGSVRCVKDDYTIPEGCKVANSDGNCRECDPGYILNEGQCEYGLEQGLAMRYDGYFITKYNAGDKNGVPIPSSVTVVEANATCSAQKCCWKAGTYNTAADGCTSSYSSTSDYSGCNRTICNYKAAVDICAQAPGGGWRLPTYSEGLKFVRASSGLGNSGLQLVDSSSANYGNVLGSNVARCYTSGNNHCYPYNTWADSGYYLHLSNGVMSYGSGWSAYTGSVRCMKTDPDFPEGCLIAHPTIKERCNQCKPGYTLSAGKCTYNLEKSYSMRYNGLFINKYNAGDEGGVPIPDTVTVVEANATCSAQKCCWKAGTYNTAADGCTSAGNGDSKYSGCKRTICNYNAAVDICSQAPGGGWRLPTYSEGTRFASISGKMGTSGLQLVDSSSANYGNVLGSNVARCYTSGNNHCYPYNTWADSGYYLHLSNGVMSFGSGWSAYTGSVRCVKEDPNFPQGCLIADENTTNKCLTCKLGYTLKNGTCDYDLETDKKSLRYNGLIITKYNAGDENGPPIPNTVTVTTAGASCSGKCCWQAINQDTAASGCTTTYGSGSDYSGCKRTICSYSAAVDICAQAPGGNWRLPSYTDGVRWTEASSYLGNNGLQLVDGSSGNYGNVYGAAVTRCYGSGNNNCYPYNTWGDGGYYLHLSNGIINFGSGWSAYTGSVRCIKDDINVIEGCLFANDKGQCAQCKPGYIVKNGACEYNLAYLEYNGLKITKYNAGDLMGPPIPNTVTVVDAGVSCSGKCCWRASANDTAAGGCTSSYGSNTDYSGCKRTVCSWSAASEICGKVPDGGWRLPLPGELEIIKNAIPTINTNKGKDGLQLCDSSSNSAGTTYCPAVARCYGSGNNNCYSYNMWGESGYYAHLSNGALSYGSGWASYTGSVRCVK